MALLTVKLSQLATSEALVTSDLFYVVKAGVSYKCTGTQLVALMQGGLAGLAPAGGASGALLKKTSGADYAYGWDTVDWGEITGTLSNQSDLATALAAKLEAVDWGDIGGTLSDQTDLQTELDAKRDYGSTEYVVGTEAGSSTIADATENFILDPAGALTAYTITMPATPSERRDVVISAGSFGVAGLTHSPNSGQSFATGAALTALPASGFAKYKWRASNSTWYRVG